MPVGWFILHKIVHLVPGVQTCQVCWYVPVIPDLCSYSRALSLSEQQCFQLKKKKKKDNLWLLDFPGRHKGCDLVPVSAWLGCSITLGYAHSQQVGALLCSPFLWSWLKCRHNGPGCSICLESMRWGSHHKNSGKAPRKADGYTGLTQDLSLEPPFMCSNNNLLICLRLLGLLLFVTKH